jgi:hypothetical protein
MSYVVAVYVKWKYDTVKKGNGLHDEIRLSNIIFLVMCVPFQYGNRSQ